MNKKSGTAGSPVEPTAPAAPHEADKADPGEMAEIKAEQIKTKSGKYGSAKVKPFQQGNEGESSADSAPGSEASEEPKKDSWIEIELVGMDDKPIAGERYRLTLPDGTVDEGTLDQNGWVRVAGFQKGECKITLPDLDQEAWKFTEKLAARKEEKS